ncbi:MED6-domain-containing protein [Artomyces pyxidatus]|uniref:MED6-domain-containing protein n=1 Tax=Artomyces pyxidatus TaxID=48021 RepID=A0ACB8TH55_9AGAM|nr:MED6-domain-containing protein [Artomyces pyxidatus]
MDQSDLHPADDYSHRFFIWHEWIQANGPLTAENVFDYFASSMFYDKQSNNQVLRMQTMHTGMPIANEAEELKRFTGVEFTVVHAEPPSLFIIHKRERISPDETRPLAAYFIMNNRIYQSPDMYNVLSNRLLTSLYSLQSSLDILRKYKPDYTPRTGFAWPIELSNAEDANKTRRPEDNVASAESEQDLEGALEKEKSSLSAASKKLQNTALLFNAMRTTAAHSSQTFELNAHQITASESIVAETPTSATVPRSSATPAPAVTSAQVATPQAASSSSGPQDAPALKGLSGAGKKKKKREYPSLRNTHRGIQLMYPEGMSIPAPVVT